MKKKQNQITVLTSDILGSEFRITTLLGVGTIIAGAVFYRLVEMWSWTDAIYFSISTLTTVGIGGMAPVTEIGKMFTSVYMLLGVGIMFAFISMVARRANNLRLNSEVDVIVCETCGK